MNIRRLFDRRSSKPEAPEGPAEGPPPAGGVGLFGKLPVRADFVRVNAGPFSGYGFERWLEDGLEALRGSGLGLPEEGCDFLLAPPAGGTACVGSLASSRDKVGRKFPALLFGYAALAGPADAVAITEAAGDFFRAARARLEVLTTGEGPAEVDLSGVQLPDSADLATATRAALAELTSSPVRDRLTALFPPTDVEPTVDALSGALGTALAACRTTGGQRPARADLTLELPAFTERDVSFWLTLLARGLAWPSGLPSWLWARSQARLVVALGPPCRELLVELGRPGRPGTRHWVVELARSSASPLPRPARSLLETPSTPVGRWLDTLA